MRRFQLTVVCALVVLAALVGTPTFAQPQWAPNTAYRIGDRVSHQAVVYEALQAHTSQVGWEPPNVPALWRVPSPAPGADWAPSTAYVLRAIVSHDGLLYEARQAHTSQVGWEPPRTPALWQIPAESGVVRDWVGQKAYNLSDVAMFQGQAFKARQAHVSVVGSFPPSLPSQWSKLVLAADCQDPSAEGQMCDRDFVRPIFPGSAAAVCRAGACVRPSVPEAVYAYPWQDGVQLNVSDVAELTAAFAEAEAHPENRYTIFLSPGGYLLDQGIEGAPLSLDTGNVILHGDPLHPEAVVIRPRDGQERLRLITAVRAGTSPPPFVAIRGITLEGAWGQGNAGLNAIGSAVLVQNGGLVIENSVISDNRGEGAAGVAVLSGFFSMDRTLVADNTGNNVLATVGTCGVGAFTQGGGVYLSLVDEGYITNSTIVGNRHCRGGGVEASSSKLYMSHNTVAKNEGQIWGGGVTVLGGGVLSLGFNTIAENLVGTRTASNQPNFGGGIALRSYTGELHLVGNVVAKNVNFRGLAPGPNPRPGIEFIADDFFVDPPGGPFQFRVTKARLNNIKNWTLGAQPSQFGIDASLINQDPGLAPIGFNGSGVGVPTLPTYLPPQSGPIYRTYSPNLADSLTAISTVDQRGFLRPSLTIATPGSVDPDAVMQLPAPIAFEAESGARAAPLQVAADANASGGSYVHAPPGTTNRTTAPGAGVTSGIMSFQFMVPLTGTYRVWGRVIIGGTGADSFWVRMNNNPWFNWNNIPAGAAWHWVLLHDSAGAGSPPPPKTFDLSSPFLNTLEISYREAGARLDRLIVTMDPGFIPTGTGP